MPGFLWIVQANAMDGRDGDFNAWYTDRHMHDVLQTPGVQAVQRFELVENRGRAEATHRYIAVYEVEAESPSAIEEAVAALRKDGRAPGSDALDRTDFVSAYYAPLTDRIVSSS